jgi:hypothetical protein
MNKRFERILLRKRHIGPLLLKRMMDIEFYLVRMGLPNTAAILALAMLPLVALGL